MRVNDVHQDRAELFVRNGPLHARRFTAVRIAFSTSSPHHWPFRICHRSLKRDVVDFYYARKEESIVGHTGCPFPL